MSDEVQKREVAHRVFATEFADSTLSFSEGGDEEERNYTVTPTGARVHRLFVASVLTGVERVTDQARRGRVVDPSGAFVTYAGQHQPDEQVFLEHADPPEFVALTGKTHTFEPEDSDQVFTSVRPESLNTVDADTRDRWVFSAAKVTLNRLAVFERALASDYRGADLRDALEAGGAPTSLATGIPKAINHYDTSCAYVEALRRLAVDALELIAGERDKVRVPEFAPDAGGDADIGPLPATDVRVEPSGATGATNMTDESTSVPTTADDRATTDATSSAVGTGDKSELAASNETFDAGRFDTKSTLVKDFSRWDNFSYDDIQQKTVLGRGTADVYEAQIPAREGSNRVVLKEPRFAGELDTDTRESFLEEARYWAEVADHPHVVDIVGWGESPHPWLVAEHLEGGDLSNRTTELDEALWICARIADALHEAHTLGLRHFDLKPENVLLRRVDDNPWDVPKVSDWGLARFQLEHSGRLSSFTPQYGAPEQFLPEKFDGLDNRTDLYQLGLVLYELTTGEHPFPDRSGAVVTEQLHKFPTPPTELDESLPSRLDEITERLLAPQPTDRYDSAAVVRNVIDRLRTGEAVGQEALADRADLYASALEYARGESLRECQRWAEEIQKFVLNNPVEDAAYKDTQEDVASFVDKWFVERELVHGSNHALMTGGDIDLANEHPELYHDIADMAEAVRRLYLRTV